MPTSSEVRQLLGELCVRLGYCLPTSEIDTLMASPPDTVHDFTDAVLVAEGRDPTYLDKAERRPIDNIVARFYGETSTGRRPTKYERRRRG